VDGLHPWVDWRCPSISDREAMTAAVRAPTLRRMSVEDATPTLASLEHARRRQLATLGLMRPLGLAMVVLVEVAGSRTEPRPGLTGERGAILLALIGVAVGVVGVIRGRRARPAVQVPFYAALVLSSATLVLLQPHGPGFLGVFVAVSAAALRIGGRLGVAVAGLALVALAVAGSLADGRSATSVALNELGVVAFYVIALLARRLGEGQEQAERLVAELEESREAQAHSAALAERQRLAREMHDVLAHSLSGLVLQLEGARLLALRKQADPDVAEAVERAHHLARAGLEEARRAIGMLRDDELPGPERLEALVHEFERDAATPCELEISGVDRALTSEARLTLYRVAQEALTNVRKHATPERVEVRLAYEPRGTRLTVEDFGGGGRPALADAGGGYGLTGMRERANLLGGELAAAATASGFRVELWVPA
jgi:signal transduction histidine kinase